jgi:Holliday junction resolvase RusA-like endonuclease
MISLWIAGQPVAQGRPRFARIGNGVRTFDPKKSSDWKHFIALRANSEGVKPFSQGTPLQVWVTFHLTRPASVSAKKRPYPTCKPDLDNFIKAAKDGLKGIAWHDDSQVVKLTAEKIYSNTPGINIEVEEYVEVQF